ncbi:MAG TPA: protein translocase subunit SecD [Candidatus Taylorbacteria bacterium]|nr:MAG: Preprotein translocase subunit SecD [Parcubacteria group bacterium GW2011_GWA2_47_64]KKU95604.1 MAG: Preprotein translocase subunit SecD [Parcubacteria group bacterium GW2011_GWC2_48_17]HBV01494.1 protein translocase subunit SecD [Candidatus Taylorbacteria bacterium]
MWKYRYWTFIIFLAAALVGFFVYKTEIGESNFAFKLGLDLRSGSHLIYRADTSSLESDDVKGAMDSLREVIERRVNLFGVSEPIVQTEEGGLLGGGEKRLIVELPGITDIKQAIELIGKTPLLEFKLMNPAMEKLSEEELKAKTVDEVFIATPLTGRFLEKSQLTFDQTTREPQVLLSFNKDGEELFAELTKANVGRILAIFLDGVSISAPVIRQEIKGGVATISGGFTPTEARDLVRNLNYGALPVPIELASTQTVGASLGDEATASGVKAGIWSFAVIALFLILWYRLPGLLAVVALAVYVAINLAFFKLIPVTLTAAGIAGFILSLGMAVDANILIFERMKEELRKGRVLSDAIQEGFKRAWTSIRDSNTSSIITAVILYYFASTPTIKGFALVFFIGVVTSMFTAITASRTLLKALGTKGESRTTKLLFGSGLLNAKR